MKALALILVLASGCTLFESLPDRSCKVPADCFRAQGETCDQNTKTCVSANTGPDAQLTSTSTGAEEPR